MYVCMYVCIYNANFIIAGRKSLQYLALTTTIFSHAPSRALHFAAHYAKNMRERTLSTKPAPDLYPLATKVSQLVRAVRNRGVVQADANVTIVVTLVAKRVLNT